MFIGLILQDLTKSVSYAIRRFRSCMVTGLALRVNMVSNIILAFCHDKVLLKHFVTAFFVLNGLSAYPNVPAMVIV